VLINGKAEGQEGRMVGILTYLQGIAQLHVILKGLKILPTCLA